MCSRVIFLHPYFNYNTTYCKTLLRVYREMMRYFEYSDIQTHMRAATLTLSSEYAV